MGEDVLAKGGLTRITLDIPEDLREKDGPSQITTEVLVSEGQRWVYFLTPWDMQLELVSFPNGKAYEADAAVKLWDPRDPAA